MFSRIRSGIGVVETRDRGASSVEYALMVAGVAAVVILALFVYGRVVLDVFVSDCTNLNGPVSANIDVSTDCG